MAEIHYRACPLCEAICGLRIEVQEGKVTSIRGDDDDPFSRGHLCPKAVALQDIHTDGDRLRRPRLRTGDGWRELEWPEALDLAARRLRRVQEEHGRHSVAVYLGNPTVHNYGALLYAPAFISALGTRNRFSATSVDQLPHHLAGRLMFGHMLLIPVPDVDRTDFFLMLGANPLASNGSLMTAPGIRRRLKELQGRGGRLVVVDPRRTETAKLADQHLFIRPGGDALLLAALLRELLHSSPRGGAGEEEFQRRLAPFTDGLEAVREAVEPFTPEAVEAGTGVAPETLRQLARDFAEAPSAVCYGRMGASTQAFGALCQWLINVINTVTGNLDRPGGALFARPAVDVVKSSGRGGVGRFKSRVRGLPEFGGELPVAALAEEMETPGEGQIRALVTHAGNPALSTPNGRRLERALGELDFFVAIDFYVNETTRHADLILPPTGPLEHEHYDLAFHALAVRNTARFSRAVFDAEPGALHDWQIFDQLRSRLQRFGPRKAPLKKRLAGWLTGRLGPRRLLDLGLRTGPYGGGLNPLAKGLRLRNLLDDPHGIDLGPLEPSLPRRLRTRDRRLHLAPEELLADLVRLREHLPAGDSAGSSAQAETGTPGEPGALQLIGRRQVRSNNSWMHNYPRLMRGKDRCTLLMHPDDATARGLADGARVSVRSRVGSIEVPLEVSDEMMAGVVSLPHGWGHGRSGVELETATEHPGASINDLTDDQRIDPVSGNAAFSGVPVTVQAAAGAGEEAAE
ncbi:MAG: molybdopterin oxidoreductase family protein [Acidobacteriota bacterium]|nr:molybdopterin oxidoreductase family protein [Acidobacteriota bacterium]